MKNTLKINNKGAALVSIMVAIAFISIISTTLLMISVNNYAMKVESGNSKRNFYETEQDINIVTAKIRTEIKGSSSNATNDVRKLVGGAEDASTYSGANLAKLVYPSAGSAVVTDNGDTFTFGSGNIDVYSAAGGDKVTLQGVTVKQVNADGFENTVKTDIEFYIKKPVSSDANAGVGDCSFLLDSPILIDSSGDSTRVNIYGCSIIGQYNFVGSKSVPKAIGVNSGALDVANAKDDASMYLCGNGGLNFLSDYTVVIGDMYICDQSIVNVPRGNFTVFGNVYLADNAALICNGNFRIGDGYGIYKVTNSSTGALSAKISSTDKDKNVILSGSYSELTESDYNGVASQLKLNDGDSTNDGITNNILVPNTAKDGTGSYYTYDFQHDDQNCDPFYLDGHQYKVTIPQKDFNNDYSYSLLFVPHKDTPDPWDTPESLQTKLTENCGNCTIIAKDPVRVYSTHGINLSQVGPEVFNYFLNNEHELKAKVQDGAQIKYFNIQGFFDPSCNSTVQSVFNSSLGGGGGSTGVAENGVVFTNWQRY